MTPSSRSYSKPASRDYMVVACDDGYIEKVGVPGYTLVACISWRGEHPGAPVEGLLAELRIDGASASSIISWLAKALSGPSRPLLLLDSVTIAGFDVVSPSTFKKLAGGEVIVVYSFRPRGERLLKALKKSEAELSEAKERVIRWMLDSLRPVETPRGRVYIASSLDTEDAARVVTALQAHSRKPEPLRVAHATASRASMELWRLGCLK